MTIAATEIKKKKVTKDPPVRKDGLCVVCKKPRDPAASGKYGGAAAALDPFCSTACCREYWGTTIVATGTRS